MSRYSDELYTPITPQLLDLLTRAKREYRYWKTLCEVGHVSPRYMRTIRGVGQKKYHRHRDRMTVSLTLLDRILTGANMGYYLREFEWYTEADLIERGLWKERGTGKG